MMHLRWYPRAGSVRFTVAAVALACAVVASCDDESHHNLMVPAPVPLGSVEGVTSVRCGDNFGDRCEQMVVSCREIADAEIRLRVTGSGTRGTIVLTTGALGTGTYWRASEGSVHIRRMVDALLDDGYRLVELIWDPPGVWEGPGGSVSLACRPATVIDWVYDTLHEGGLFAAQGNSGGNAQIAFSLAYYGLGEVIDLANLSSGPPPCPISTNGKLNQDEQGECIVTRGGWDESKEPILSGNPQLDYPGTLVRLFIGEEESNYAIIEAAHAFHDAITSEKSLQVVPNAGHRLHRSDEGAAALTASIRAVGGSGERQGEAGSQP